MTTARAGLAALPQTIVLAVFFASGFSALLYQVVWVEMLEEVFGVTTLAASAVLGSYFGGLALGGLLGGRLFTKIDGLRLYGVIEIVLGAAALSLPLLLAQLTDAYRALHPYLADRQLLLWSARFLLSLAVLVAPVTLIGMALPVLVRVLTTRDEEIGRQLPRLYGWNTFGSVLGSLLTGYVLIGLFGLRQTMYLAIATNFVVGIIALWVSRSRSTHVEPAREPSELRPTRQGHDAAWRTTALAATFCSGFAALGYEVAWFRVLGLMSDHRAHTFSAIVALVLLGIGVGSFLMVKFHRRAYEPATMLAGVLVGLGLLGMSWLPLVTGLSGVLATAAAMFAPVPERSDVPFAVAIIVTFLPCLLMGMNFPLAVQLYTKWSGRVGESVGRMYALNLIGAMLGSIVTGFVLLPLLGAQLTLSALSLIFLAAAALVHYQAGHKSRSYGVAGVAACATIVVGAVPAGALDALFVRVHPHARIVESYEDIEATVTVAERGSTRIMYINGAHQADDSPWTIGVHRLIGLIPCLVHGSVQDALVIGIGGGTTAGEVARCASGRTTIVEISPGVVRAARSFAALNRNIADSSRAEMIVADGRNHLLVADRRYDVMTADTIRPVHAQSSNLYSYDYYRLMRSRLKTNGIVFQWIDTSLRDHEEAILKRTFVRAFPHVAMSDAGGNTFLIGSSDPLSLDARTLRPRITPAVIDDLARTGVSTPEAFLASFALAGDALRAAIGPGPIISDDRPINEYFNLLRIGGLWKLLPEEPATFRPGS
jgi:spermidine synthase